MRLLLGNAGKLSDNHQACQRAKAEHKPDKIKLGASNHFIPLIIPGGALLLILFRGAGMHLRRKITVRGVADKLDQQQNKNHKGYTED